MAAIRASRPLQQPLLHRSSLLAYSNVIEALEQQTAKLTISSEAEAKILADTQKREAKALAKQSKLAAEAAASKVVLKRIERGKRKYVTAIANLGAFTAEESKAVAKKIAQRFATGASVSRTVEGKEEVVVQGDLAEEIEEFLVEKYKIPEERIVIREEKAKKG
jgi:density-regulated protein